MSSEVSKDLGGEFQMAATELEKVIPYSGPSDATRTLSRNTPPKPSSTRLEASSAEQPLDLVELLTHRTSPENDKETILYLGYGSNLSAEAFLVKRGIKPLAQVNIVAPAIRLTFNLPGVPYKEPCFGNCEFRDTGNYSGSDERGAGYHKDAWKKGLVGVVYEVTKSDYAHIIATEGGGSGYKDILVECFALSDNAEDEVPECPDSAPFKAHTLYASSSHNPRPDPSYAQPSARYLKLITDGAAEHSLPLEYRHYLENIRTYRMTTLRQKLGALAFLILWGPIFAFIFRGGAKMFLRPDGTYPKWFGRLTRAVFRACWTSYDHVFYPVFGDGERTVQGEGSTDHEPSTTEKSPLLPVHSRDCN